MKPKMSDGEVSIVAKAIFEELRQYGPRDASSIITYVNWLIIQKTFLPSESKKALAAIDAEAKLLRQFVKETGWS